MVELWGVSVRSVGIYLLLLGNGTTRVAGSVQKGTDAKSPQGRPTRLAGYGLKVGGGRTRIRSQTISIAVFLIRVHPNITNADVLLFLVNIASLNIIYCDSLKLFSFAFSW